MRHDPVTRERLGAASGQVACRLICHGCGYEVAPDDLETYRCPRAGQDDADHVLRREFDPAQLAGEDPASIFRRSEPNPFLEFRRLFLSYQSARRGGLSDAAYVRIAERLDDAVATVSGLGFRETPFEPSVGLARALDLDRGELWIKDETGNVAGSHKARHLMGIMLHLEVRRALAPERPSPPLATASCGNAALAAATIARATSRPIDVFVPPEVKPSISRSLSDLEARLVTCERRPDDRPGDPCYLRLLESEARGAMPFSAQGPRNALGIEGGSTLSWEMVSVLSERAARLDHLVIQVGGGALAASCMQGLREARALGVLADLPRIHTVQTRSSFPLRRAYDRLLHPDSELDLTENLEDRNRAALRIASRGGKRSVADRLRFASRHRSEFMTPWETKPESIAYGILDDETYDWLAVVEGMLDTGGIPLVVSEEELEEAHRMAREQTGVRVEPTGSAGLAGLVGLRRAGIVGAGQSAAVLFTGAER